MAGVEVTLKNLKRKKCAFCMFDSYHQQQCDYSPYLVVFGRFLLFYISINCFIATNDPIKASLCFLRFVCANILIIM